MSRRVGHRAGAAGWICWGAHARRHKSSGMHAALWSTWARAAVWSGAQYLIAAREARVQERGASRALTFSATSAAGFGGTPGPPAESASIFSGTIRSSLHRAPGGEMGRERVSARSAHAQAAAASARRHARAPGSGSGTQPHRKASGGWFWQWRRTCSTRWWRLAPAAGPRTWPPRAHRPARPATLTGPARRRKAGA